MTDILRFHIEIGKMPVVLGLCPWPRKNFKVFGLGLDLKVLGLTTTLVNLPVTPYPLTNARFQHINNRLVFWLLLAEHAQTGRVAVNVFFYAPYNGTNSMIIALNLNLQLFYVNNILNNSIILQL